MVRIQYSCPEHKAMLYIEALKKAGALSFGGYLSNADLTADGLLICGGVDLNPKHYGEEINGTAKIDDLRDENEFRLIEAFYKAKKPIFGICRGVQMLNVYFGGTLIQDIKSDVLHTVENGAAYHNVISADGSVLSGIYGNSFTVNSYHHQAVKEPATDFTVTARAKDGIAEAIHHRSLPIFGVQWHPEREAADTVDGQRLFDYFIKLCESKN